MANNPGAKKAIRKIAARTEVNKARRTRVRKDGVRLRGRHQSPQRRDARPPTLMSRSD